MRFVDGRHPHLRIARAHRRSCRCEPHSCSQPPRLCSGPASSPCLRLSLVGLSFRSSGRPIFLATWGYWTPLPPPSIPISKGLTRFLPMYPHAPMLQIKALTAFLPIPSPFLLKNTKRNGFPLRPLPTLRFYRPSPAFCPIEMTEPRARLL